MVNVVLVHSPLVGPTTWRWVAEELRRRGHGVLVPAFSHARALDDWASFVDDLVGQIPDLDGAVFVAHSGAGLLLPTIVARSRATDPTLVFVDAGVPSADGPTELLPDELLDELRARADQDGVLPPWSEWFGPGAVEELLPEPSQREAVTSELRGVPLRYFARPVPGAPLPTVAGYVQLSESYADHAARADEQGWDVVRIAGDHLSIVTRPQRVADAILAVCRTTRV